MAATWTPEQQAGVLDEAWSRGGATCPVDGSALMVRHHPPATLMRVSCPACGSMASATRETDPRAGDFRPWTEGEKAALMQGHRLGRPLACPVDGARLLEKTLNIPGGMVKLICDRCGESHGSGMEG